MLQLDFVFIVVRNTLLVTYATKDFEPHCNESNVGSDSQSKA